MGSDYYERPFGEGSIPPIGVGDNVTVKRAILDKNVTIGGDSKILNVEGVQEADSDRYYIRDGVVIIPKNAIIPPNTVI